MKAFITSLSLGLLLSASASAQQATRTEPVEGIRDNGTGFHALVKARVVTAPGQAMDNATIVIRNGLIQSVQPGGAPPAGARVWDLTGHTVYAGFIDAHADLGRDSIPKGGDVGPTHWNPQVRAWFSTTANLQDDANRRKGLRSQGFGTALVVPKRGIFRGSAAVVSLTDAGVRDRVLRPDVAQSIGFQSSFELGGRYPNSSMGVIALMKQTFMDAEWYKRAWTSYETGGRAFLPPETSEALKSLEAAVAGAQPVIFETRSEEEILRGQALAKQFKLNAWYRGSGEEYRIIDVLRGSKAPLFVPINFPDAPNVGDPEQAMNATLGELRHWYLAPTNAGQLANAGVEFSITSDGLTSLNNFLPNLRTAVARGLSADAALAALTTTPARYLGIDRTHGTVAAGKVANLVVAKGDLFARETDIRDVWVQGVVYGVTRPAQIDPRGTWTVQSGEQWGFEAKLVLEGTLNRLKGYLDVSPGPNAAQGARIDLESATVIAETGRLEVRFPGEKLGYEGKALLAGSVTGDQFYGWTSLPNGASPSFRGTRTTPFTGDAAAGTTAVNVPRLDLPFIRPMMDYGVTAIPQQPAAVFVRNATVWTQGPQGKLEGADVLIRAGKIAQVGKGLSAPAGATVIDGTGKHVTPGLIDPHIHSGVSDVNETGATIVPEVYMGDVITHNNISMYRQLAGGLTTAMIKHGSANPIGGENVIVKLRWGSLPEALKLEGATRTVKFALGENPKRCCYEGRYPRSRMGTQEIIRDHFLAARDYRREWQEWEKTKKGLPPRRDLRMDAILDILDQKLLISSHGYRADEYLALIRLAEEFGFRVQTLQHGVEAYKIAPELAKAGVAAAVWSDWGAFKMEAYDATKYNVRILMEAGVTVSLHSDDGQIASRMNWEAGKLLRTGLTPEQALTTVTLNAAKVLAIQDRVGSLEAGKDADFVVWSGDPLSQFTRAEQTWVDGRRYFSLEDDATRRAQVARERQQLIQAVLAASGSQTRAASTNGRN